MSPFLFLLMILIFWAGLPSILIMLNQWSALPSIFQVCWFIHLFVLPYLPPYKDHPVLNGCVNTSLKGMLTDSPRSNSKRDFWSLQLLRPGAQEKQYNAIKQAAPHLKDFPSCALPAPDSDEEGLQENRS